MAINCGSQPDGRVETQAEVDAKAPSQEKSHAQKNSQEILQQLEILAKVHFLESDIMGERRQLNVYVPPHYESRPDEKFPVIYLLDGAFMEDYHHVSGLIQFLTYYELMPPSIMVGIANVDRYRDFTAPSSVAEDRERLPTSGGSAKFRQFLEKELQPFIENTYRVNDTKTLIGQSLGGLLAAEVLISTPDLFDHYMIISPSFWWDKSSLLTKMENNPGTLDSQKVSVFLALGEEGPEMQAGMDRFVKFLEQMDTSELSWHYQSFPEETHATILHRALYAGFEWMYGKTHPGL